MELNARRNRGNYNDTRGAGAFVTNRRRKSGFNRFARTYVPFVDPPDDAARTNGSPFRLPLIYRYDNTHTHTQTHARACVCASPCARAVATSRENGRRVKYDGETINARACSDYSASPSRRSVFRSILSSRFRKREKKRGGGGRKREQKRSLTRGESEIASTHPPPCVYVRVRVCRACVRDRLRAPINGRVNGSTEISTFLAHHIMLAITRRIAVDSADGRRFNPYFPFD